jgi:hypothetical protein
MKITETLRAFHETARKPKPHRETSPDEIEARKFQIESFPFHGRTIILVSKEGQQVINKLATDPMKRQKLDPRGWENQVRDAMKNNDVSIVFMWYFLPELARDLFQSRFSGKPARRYAVEEQNITSFYEPVERIAAELGKTVAVANIATGPGFRLYELTPPNIYFYRNRTGAYGVNSSRSEHFIPQAADAQRMWTAEAISKMIDERVPEGESVLLAAAPAHTKRVKQYMTEQQTTMDAVRRRVYLHTLLGLNTSIRLWRHDVNPDTQESEWTQHEEIQYITPGEQLKPYAIAGIAAGVGSAYLAHRRRKRG